MQGRFQPRNPKKYIGDATKIRYLSSWELIAMNWFDTNPGILSWTSENTILNYMDPTSNRMRRYLVDFTVKADTVDGPKIYLIEVKPLAQTRAPKKTEKKSEFTYANEMATWIKNQGKWTEARRYCAEHGYEFQIWTERELVPKIPKLKSKKARRF